MPAAPQLWPPKPAANPRTTLPVLPVDSPKDPVASLSAAVPVSPFAVSVAEPA